MAEIQIQNGILSEKVHLFVQNLFTLKFMHCMHIFICTCACVDNNNRLFPFFFKFLSLSFVHHGCGAIDTFIHLSIHRIHSHSHSYSHDSTIIDQTNRNKNTKHVTTLAIFSPQTAKKAGHRNSFMHFFFGNEWMEWKFHIKKRLRESRKNNYVYFCNKWHLQFFSAWEELLNYRTSKWHLSGNLVWYLFFSHSYICMPSFVGSAAPFWLCIVNICI